MTVKLVLFFLSGMIFLPGRKKGGIVGTMCPNSIPLANRPSLMAQTRPGPKLSRPRNVGTKPKTQSAQERPGEPSPKYPGASYPGLELASRAGGSGWAEPTPGQENNRADRAGPDLNWAAISLPQPGPISG